MKKWLIFTLLVLSAGLAGYGEQTNNNLYLYENYTLRLKSSYWEGLEAVRKCNNKTYKAGILGAEPGLYALLTNSPSSRAELDGYSSSVLIGNILYWGGLGFLLADIILISTAPNFMLSSSTGGYVVYFSLLLGGFTTSMVGIGFLYSAQNTLYNAVWQFNKDIMAGTTKTSMNKDINFGITLNTKF